MVWVMTALMKNPKVMKKVQEKVRKLIGKKDMVDEDDVLKLPYLKSVIKEAMRLYPPVLLLPQQAIDMCIIDGGQDFQLIPFGAGRRGCPGINLGIATVELALANLLYSFGWELPDGMKKEDIDTNVMPGVTMHKKNALA
ncbi:hypothetical protein CsSME_00013567 [Camellia sinensis var. sinensis]